MVSEDIVNQSQIFSFKIKRQAKIVFPNDDERTIGSWFIAFAFFIKLGKPFLLKGNFIVSSFT